MCHSGGTPNHLYVDGNPESLGQTYAQIETARVTMRQPHNCRICCEYAATHPIHGIQTLLLISSSRGAETTRKRTESRLYQAPDFIGAMYFHLHAPKPRLFLLLMLMHTHSTTQRSGHGLICQLSSKKSAAAILPGLSRVGGVVISTLSLIHI